MRRAEAQNKAQAVAKPTGGTTKRRSVQPGGREARLEFRLTRATRERIEKAALASGQSLSEFATSALAREADAVLQRHHERALSERDWERFSEMLLRPPSPTAALQAAAQAYGQAAQAEGDATTVDAQAWRESLGADLDLLHDPH